VRSKASSRYSHPSPPWPGRPPGQARSDAYPDNHNWTDTGCHLSPTCLSCPLPTCYLELSPRWKHILAKPLHVHRLIAYLRNPSPEHWRNNPLMPSRAYYRWKRLVPLSTTQAPHSNGLRNGSQRLSAPRPSRPLASRPEISSP